MARFFHRLLAGATPAHRLERSSEKHRIGLSVLSDHSREAVSRSPGECGFNP